MRRFLWLLALVPALLGAQSFTASVRGVVTDPTQAGVPDATVTLTEVNRNLAYSTKSDAAGRYILLTIPPGTYSLTVEAPGFRKYSVAAFALEVQQQATINAELTVGDVTTTVEVTGSAPLLNTAAAGLGQLIENKYIQTMPLSGRNPLALLMLTPGLVPSNISAGGVSNTNFVAGGVRNSTSDILLDGMVITGIEQNSGITNVKITPSVDIIEEFKVQTNFYSAEFGNTGGAIINMVSKSGTNSLHGTVYDFHRSSGWDANSFFSNRAGRGRTDSRRDIFGGTAGGPILIPKLYDGRNRTFFFFDYEGSRTKSATTTTRTVPTARQKAGDFSDTRLSNGALSILYDPYDTYVAADGRVLRRPIPGNIIPPARLNPTARELLKFFPEPTSEGAVFTRVNNFFNQGTNRSVGDRLGVKTDHNLSAKQRFTSRYTVTWGSSNPANLSDLISENINPSSNRAQNFVYDYTRTHDPATIITARLGVLRYRFNRAPISMGYDVTKIGLSAILQTWGIRHFPRVEPGGYTGVGPAGWAIMAQYEDVVALTGSLSRITGGHTIKVGSELRGFRENYFQPGYPGGLLSFSRNQTGENPLLATTTQGDGIASMLLGWGSGGSYDSDFPVAAASQYFGLYAQDDWRITRKLTLNLGLRYDFDVPRTERFNRLNWYDWYAPSPIAARVPAFPNLKGVMRFVDDKKRSPFEGDWNNIQPRIGIAYALTSKTSLRLGYGMFYTAGRHTIKGEVGAAFRSSSSIQWSRDNDYTQFATFQNLFPVGLTAPWGRDPLAFLGFGFSSYDPESKNPQYQQWNFSIQRLVPGNGVVEVNYAGSKGTYLYFGSGDVLGNRNKLHPIYYGLGRTALNAMVPNPFHGVITDPRSVLSLPTTQYHRLLRPFPQHAGGVGGYVAPPNIGNSNYHSVQLKYERRFSRGLAMVAHYTISKMISDSDSPGTDVDSWLGGSSGVQCWTNLRLERSLAVFDIPQRAVITFNYQVPLGRGRAIGGSMNRVLDGVVGGWEASGILTFSSGYPITPSLSGAMLWDANQRPNLIGDPRTFGSPARRLDQYFNLDAFSRPASDTYGTAPRTLANYRTFGIRNADLTLMKNFAIKEQKSVQLRIESYNATNTPTFGVPSASFGATAFGIISGYASGRGARTVQAAVKLYY